jgi:hypothetical protein
MAFFLRQGLVLGYIKKCNNASRTEVSHKSNGKALSNETTKEYNPVAEPHGSSLNDHWFESVKIMRGVRLDGQVPCRLVLLLLHRNRWTLKHKKGKCLGGYKIISGIFDKNVGWIFV